MPPAEGDAEAFRTFRAAFADKLSFAVVEYPAWRDILRSATTISDIGDCVVSQILARHDGPYYLVGYSFGGFVAWDAAQKLRAKGRDVRFVGLIDTRLSVPGDETPRQALFRKLINVVREPRRMAVRIGWRVVFPSMLRTLGPRGFTRTVGLTSWLPFGQALDASLSTEVRLLTLDTWQTKFLDAPVSVFRTDEFSPLYPDFGWGEHCRHLEIVSVGGNHVTVFDQPWFGVLCERFLAAVEAAQNGSAASNVIPSRE